MVGHIYLSSVGVVLVSCGDQLFSTCVSIREYDLQNIQHDFHIHVVVQFFNVSVQLFTNQKWSIFTFWTNMQPLN